MDDIKVNHQKVHRLCVALGAGTPEHAECERVYCKGRPVGYALRYLFPDGLARDLGERIIREVSVFGRIIRQLNGSGDAEDEAVLEVSFKF